MIPEITIKISMHPEGVAISKGERVVEEDFSAPPPPEVEEAFGDDFSVLPPPEAEEAFGDDFSVPPPPEAEEAFGDDFSVPPPPEEDVIAEEEKDDYHVPPPPEVEGKVLNTDVDGAPEVSSKKRPKTKKS